MTLTYHRLIAPPSGCNGGIYWLQVYRHDPQNPVVILTEVPGNPGYSITNAMDALVAHCAEQCGVPIDFLHLYEIWPAESLDAHSVRQISRIVYKEHPNDVLSNSLQPTFRTLQTTIKCK